MYIKRKLEQTILRYVSKPEIIAIVGPRQSGKTTLLKSIAEKLDNSTFISFDDIETLQMFENHLDDFINLYVRGREFLFIDEFQYSRQGGKILKRLYDSHKIKIFLSGSSNIDLTVQAVKYLVGRIFVFNLYPFDFAEFLSYKNADYLRFLPKGLGTPLEEAGPQIHASLNKYYEEYLIFGGYPRVVLADDFEEKKEVLKNIYNTYFLREVKDILGLVDDFKLNKLIQALALQIGNLVDYHELSLVSEFSHVSVKKYLNFLEKTFICGLIRPYFKNRRVEIVKNPKAYFFDTGLRNAIIADFRPLNLRPEAGVLLENGVFQQLIKKGIAINYWRDKQKREVDFVISLEDGKKAAIEVKKNWAKSLFPDGLKFFSKLHPEVEIVRASFEKKEKDKEANLRPVYSF